MNATFNSHDRAYRPDIIDKLFGYRILVCGAGAVGSNLIDNLTRIGANHIAVIDFDRVTDKNQGTQVYNMRQIGSLKARALQGLVYENTGTLITPLGLRLERRRARQMLAGYNLIVEAFDNAESKMVVNEFCVLDNHPCIHVGLHEDYAGIRWASKEYHVAPSNVDLCDYPLARNIVTLTVAVLSETILRYIKDGSRSSWAITLNDLKIWSI